jgi:hypothetical protein
MISKLIPFKKNKDGLADLNNLRPIMVTSLLIKILEAIILNKLKAHCESNKIIDIQQRGFIERSSTSINIVELFYTFEKIKEVRKGQNNKEKKENIYTLFIDFKSAFDKVDHTTLFQYLNTYNLPTDLINKIAFIYSVANANIYDSKPFKINCGVLQGSLISPFVFNLYVNSLFKEVNNICINYMAYADDMYLLFKAMINSCK